jgi:hypothetical protein
MERLDLGKGRSLIINTPEEIERINRNNQESIRLGVQASSLVEQKLCSVLSDSDITKE